MARSYLRQARDILGEAERHHQAKRWHLAVRRSQETVELALKALLRASGIEVPHVHDVGVFLLDYERRLPPAAVPHLDRLVSVSRRLRQEREISFYGDEETGAPPDRLYTASDGDDALREARFVVELCGECVGPWPPRSGPSSAENRPPGQG
jgi:HEPN domain-containing protein